MQKLVQISKVMSDINRVKILTLVIREKEVCVCEICDTLKLSQPLVSRHLKQMREANILETDKKGKWIIYKLTQKLDPFLVCITNELQKNIDKIPKLIKCDIIK